MLAFVLRRLVVSVLLILALLTLVFFIMHLAPGDPLAIYQDPDIDPRMIEQLRHQFGLDQPLLVQYFKWMRAFLLDFDFGISVAKHRPVAQLLADAIPNTLRLASWALVVRLLVGVALGIVSAVRRGGKADVGLTVGALVVYSMPTFWLGLMMILVFGFQLRWLPAGQMESLDHASLAWAARLWDSTRHLILPVFVLGIGGVASTVRFMRASLLEVLSQDYVRAARAKGLEERSVILKHALRNALLPIVTLVGLSVPSLVGGSVIIEHVFSWPGMGRLTIEAISQRDYWVIMATTFLSGVMVVLGNFLADVTYSLLDPRIRLES
ncbi:MAG: ABC transporter permease [Candidatus Krumholzibacteriia bacterium]